MSEERSITTLDSSQIETWLECQKKYSLSYQEHLVPITESNALGMGKAFHKLLELFYKTQLEGFSRGESVQWALASVKAGLEKESLSESFDWNMISMRFISYVEFYMAQKWKILGTEVGFSIPIFETSHTLLILEGKIDLVVQSGDRIFWVDTKTQSRTYDYYRFKPQFLNYCLAVNSNHGVIDYVGFMQSNDPAKIFRRQPIWFSTEQLKEWKWELISIFMDIRAAQAKNRYRKNRKACKNGLNRECQFCHICEQTTPEFANEVKALEYKTREPWSPWNLEESNGRL